MGFFSMDSRHFGKEFSENLRCFEKTYARLLKDGYFPEQNPF